MASDPSESYGRVMDLTQPLKWAVIGALTLVVVDVAAQAFSWYVGGAECEPSALLPVPFLAVIGGAIGGLAGTYRRRTLRRRSQLEKRKHLSDARSPPIAGHAIPR